MKRTDAEAHDSNRYTEGNPALGIPATVVGAEEMNNIQEEIVNVVLDAGITLSGSTETQLLAALNTIIGRGGTQLSQAITDNVSDTVITGLVFDKTDYKGARALIDMHRRDDGQSANEIGELYITHDTEADSWDVFLASHDGDCDVTFNITAAGQVRYSSSNYGGANYSGTMRVTNITTLAQ